MPDDLVVPLTALAWVLVATAAVTVPLMMAFFWQGFRDPRRPRD